MADDAKREALVKALRAPAGSVRSHINAKHMRSPQPQKPAYRPSFVRG